MIQLRFFFMIIAVGLMPLLAFAQNGVSERVPRPSKEAATRTVEDGGTGLYKAFNTATQ